MHTPITKHAETQREGPSRARRMPATAPALSQGDEPAAAPSARSGLEAQLAEARALLDEQALHFPLDLQFTWRHMAFAARLVEASAPGGARLSLNAELGLLPYSIEDAGARQAALAGLRDLNREDRDSWSAGADGRVRLASETVLEVPQTRPDAIESIALLFLTLKPRVDMLAPLLYPARPARTAAVA